MPAELDDHDDDHDDDHAASAGPSERLRGRLCRERADAGS